VEIGKTGRKTLFGPKKQEKLVERKSIKRLKREKICIRNRETGPKGEWKSEGRKTKLRGEERKPCEITGNLKLPKAEKTGQTEEKRRIKQDNGRGKKRPATKENRAS